jgi:serine/threonine protein phosphatase PrpC
MSEQRSNARLRLVVAGLTDVGRLRKHNEDHVLLKPDVGLFVVADGMGGHNAGDVASKLTATSIANFFEATAEGAPVGDLPDDYDGLADAARRLAAGVRKANSDVHTISNTFQQHHGMGSTIVSLYADLDEGTIHIGHVGDSRCYRLRDGEIEQMTRDHSLINDALDMKPDLTKEELARLPKNIITRALGMKDVVKVDLRSEPLLPGDVFLLCSDGLSGLVPPDQILEIITITDDPQEACELLIAEANDRGGNDNISAVILRVEEETAAESSPDLEVAPSLEVASEFWDAPTSDAAFPSEDAPASDPMREDAPVSDPAREDAPVHEPVPAVAVAIAPVVEVASDPEAEAAADEEPRAESSLDGEVRQLLAGDAVDLNVQGPWPNDNDDIPRCRRCATELLPGNLFCVECGLRIEDEDEAVA